MMAGVKELLFQIGLWLPIMVSNYYIGMHTILIKFRI